METFAKNEKVEQLQRQLYEVQSENERLKHEGSLACQNYIRQLESKEDVIRGLKMRIDEGPRGLSPREENAIRQENRILRDKVAELSRDLDLIHQERRAPSALEALENENRRLRSDIADKDREH